VILISSSLVLKTKIEKSKKEQRKKKADVTSPLCLFFSRQQHPPKPARALFHDVSPRAALNRSRP
jgi:hypothetical protein